MSAISAETQPERQPARQQQRGPRSRTAVVLVNLGTPEAPTAAAVRSYLKEFLSDRRVVEIPRWLWQIILRVVILPFRSKQSASKYEAIWTAEGSPLKVHTARQALLLRGLLGERGHDLAVEYAMRYGSPSLPQVLKKLKADGIDRMLIVPAYPQYAGSTTASVYDAVHAHYAQARNVPELRFVKHYHDHAGYIRALAESVNAYWSSNGRPDLLMMSFHGVPKRTVMLGDPYFVECQRTARLLASQLGLQDHQFMLTFQSRFGKAEWLGPYTATSLADLGRNGVQRVDVVCPGFTSDCLETLEEIAIEARTAFLQAGGKEFHYLPCLNEAPQWIAALADLTEQHLQGWPTKSTSNPAQ
ncbi:MAG: ferrochelatase [Burkholderiaceae bacterium]|nr:ferrochelatase [Burkholderiaceae bacterium]